MNKRFVQISLLLALIIIFSLCAIDPHRATRAANTSASTTNNLDALINGLQAKYSRMNGLAANFVQIYNGNDGRRRRESGSLLLKRPGKARWDYASPERKIFVSDGKNIFFYVYGERHATRAKVKESADPQIPFLFLLGRGNLRKDFKKIEIAAGESPSAPGNVVLMLVPKRAPEEFRQLLAEIDPQSFSVKRLVIFERNGSRMDFLLSNVRENHVAADGEFRFTPPQGVSVQEAN